MSRIMARLYHAWFGRKSKSARFRARFGGVTRRHDRPSSVSGSTFSLRVGRAVRVLEPHAAAHAQRRARCAHDIVAGPHDTTRLCYAKHGPHGPLWTGISGCRSLSPELARLEVVSRFSHLGFRLASRISAASRRITMYSRRPGRAECFTEQWFLNGRTKRRPAGSLVRGPERATRARPPGRSGGDRTCSPGLSSPHVWKDPTGSSPKWTCASSSQL